MDRRSLLAALIAGGANLLAPSALGAATTRALPVPPAYCGLEAASPRRLTRQVLRPPPFSSALPLPLRLDATAGPVELALHAADVELLPGTTTPMLTYNGSFPGPTIVATVGRTATVELHNELSDPAVLHLHGTHAPADQDGHVRDEIPPATSRPFVYPNLQRPAQLWYHDHLLMRTAERIIRGLTGAYVLLDPAERDLGLPVDDERDVTVMLTDRSFNDDGTLAYDAADLGPFFGDVILVNGADRPRLEVAAGLLRLRVINASNARPYVLQRSDGEDLVQIATDGGLLDRPVPRQRLEVWPAERVELLWDLSGAPVGSEIDLVDQLAAGVGDGRLMRVQVVEGSGGTPSGAPQVLPPLEELGPPEVTRTITLDAAGAMFLLNGHGYDPDLRDVYARLGAVERWRLVNTTPASHPIHLHLVSFRVIRRTDRQGAAVPLRPEDEGWKDVVLVRGGETVEIDARFDDHLGDFMYHCHILEHEDHDMMSQFRVVDLARLAGRNRVETSAAVAASLDGPRRVLVLASGLEWPGALAGAALADALLLVTGDSLDEAARAELERRPPAEILIAGGYDLVPAAVEEQARAYAPTRRVDTSEPEPLAAGIATTLTQRSSTVVLATSQVFADALAAGSLGVPVLLTDPAALSPEASSALETLGAREVIIAGGAAAVSATVAQQLEDAGYDVERIWGVDRFATAVAFARRAGLSTTVYAASAGRFPDALSAGIAARRDGMLVLVDDRGVDPATAALLEEAQVSRAVIVGGEAAVPLAAEASLASRLVDRP